MNLSKEDPDKDLLLTEGSLWRAIWVMSWPLILSTISSSIVSIVDIQVSGLLGSTTQAAVGLSEQILFLFMIFIMSTGVGTTAIVSQAFGARDTKRVIEATAQSLSLGLLIGVALALLAWLTARLLLPLFSHAPSVIHQGQIYLSIFALYLIPFSIICIFNAALRAIGDARTPLIVIICTTCLNVVGDYLTVAGNWPVAHLGIRGIALSAIFADTVGVGLALYFLNRSTLKASLRKLLSFNYKIMRQIADIGIPSAFQRMSWAAAVLGLFFTLSHCHHPTEALASWTIGMRVEGFLFMILIALSMAASSIVGQNLGAKEFTRAFRAGWHISSIGIALLFILASALFVFAGALAHAMSHDVETIKFTTSYLQINALADPFLALSMVLGGALQGAGDTRITMWITLFSNWLIRLPLAWWLAITLKFGPNGAWIAMSTSVIIGAMLVSWRYQSRAWINNKLT